MLREPTAYVKTMVRVRRNSTCCAYCDLIDAERLGAMALRSVFQSRGGSGAETYNLRW
jgi:hypothetical protein